MIICDYNKKIRYYLAGYPGSCHDNFVYINTGFARKPQDYFLLIEHDMGDSAFANSPHMVSSFRKAKGELLEPDNEAFNTKLAKLRIRSEHCIGILKGRFPWLRSIQMKVTDDPKSMRCINICTSTKLCPPVLHMWILPSQCLPEEASIEELHHPEMMQGAWQLVN